MIHTPEYWVLIKTPDCYKILAGWKGGYLHGDEWRLSSGVTEVKDIDDQWLITNHSGSQYYCAKFREGLITIMADTYQQLMQNGCTRVSVEDYEHSRETK